MGWKFFNSSGQLQTEAPIADDSVTNAKLANTAAYTIKGNATSSSANPTDISLASATGGYSIHDDDIVLTYDADGSALKTITRGNFLSGVGGARTVSPTNVDNAVITFVDSGDTFAAEANLTFDGTNLTVATGNVIIGTAGKGIDFSVNTQSAVSGAAMVSEVLDWYEEGTWTPIAKDHDGGTMSQQSNGDEGKYTRIGNTVYIQCRVICNGNGSATTSKTLTIHGLPFTHQNATNLQAHPHVGFAAATANPSATVSYGSLIEPGNSFINIMSWDVTTGQSNTVISEFSHDGQLGITGHYFVS